MSNSEAIRDYWMSLEEKELVTLLNDIRTYLRAKENMRRKRILAEKRQKIEEANNKVVRCCRCYSEGIAKDMYKGTRETETPSCHNGYTHSGVFIDVYECMKDEAECKRIIAEHQKKREQERKRKNQEMMERIQNNPPELKELTIDDLKRAASKPRTDMYNMLLGR